jgi:Ser-tRNA(Ala) deacylase AlaX
MATAMTSKVFWDDPYRTTLDATVTWAEGASLALDRTILFAFSGGQERDEGTIGGFPVLNARWEDGGRIVYTLPEGHGLTPGAPVALTLDWERRRKLMRLHFAAELVLEHTYRLLAPVEKVGAHIAADKARLDFRLGQPITPHLPELNRLVSEMIAADLPIVSTFADEATEERYWEIDGFARVPCGGTHPKRTGEVGVLALKRRNPGKGVERIEITLV